MEQPRSILIQLQRQSKGESCVNEDNWYVPMKINGQDTSLYLDTGAAGTWILASKVGLEINNKEFEFTQTHADGERTDGYIHNEVQVTSADDSTSPFSLTLSVALVPDDGTKHLFMGNCGMLGLCGPAWQNGPNFLQQLVDQARIPNKFAVTLSTQDDGSWIEFGGDLANQIPKSENKPYVEVEILTMESPIRSPLDRLVVKNNENAKVGDWVIDDIAYRWGEWGETRGGSRQRFVITMYPDNHKCKRQNTERHILCYYEASDEGRVPIMIDNGWSGLALPYEVAERVNKAMFGLTELPVADNGNDNSWCDHPVFQEKDLVDGVPHFELNFALIIGDKAFSIPDASLVRKRNGNWESEIMSKHTSGCYLGDTFLKHVVAVHDVENKKMIFRGK
jgi:predicted aspartyl protease